MCFRFAHFHCSYKYVLSFLYICKRQKTKQASTAHKVNEIAHTHTHVCTCMYVCTRAGCTCTYVCIDVDLILIIHLLRYYRYTHIHAYVCVRVIESMHVCVGVCAYRVVYADANALNDPPSTNGLAYYAHTHTHIHMSTYVHVRVHGYIVHCFIFVFLLCGR